MNKSVFKIILLLFVVICFTQTSLAQCIGVCSPSLYEEFNYPASSSIHNAVGGSGWASAWDVQNANTTVPGYSISSTSLSSGSLKAFNNRLSGGNLFLTIGRFLNTSNTSNAPFTSFIDSANLIGKSGTTLYYSVLMRKNGNNTQQLRTVFHKGNTSWNAATTGSVGIGYFGTASETSGTKFWSLQVEGTTFKTNVPISIGSTALLVLKIEFLNGSTKYSLFVNPASIGSGGEPATATLTQTANKMMDFKAMAVYLGDAASQGDIDEIRMSSTYQCATPDSTTAFNLLPNASFTSNLTAGTAPFTVAFNGASSNDPDGSIASYVWSFSDGGTGVGSSSNYLFKNQGAIIATLTVTDNCGSTGSSSATISVNNTKGYFSCFSTPRLSKFGACDSISGGGEIIIGGGTSYSLLNKKTGTITNQTSGTFSNLNAGFYRLSASGVAGCKDTFNIQVPISHECPGQARGSQMKMGVNLESLDYFNQCAMFKDYMRTSGSFFTFNATGSSPFNTNVMSEVLVDSSGYPLQVPANTSLGAQKVRKMLSSTNKHLPTGNYVLLYDGTGSLIINGGTIISSAPNRIVYNITGTGNVWLDVLSSSSSDHVRNIRLLTLADEATYLTQPFTDKFLRTICNFSCMRFMQMQCTIGNANSVWSGRTIPSYHSQSQLATADKGIAYEHICQLANITGKDIWVCVPHLVDDNYITEMAKLFKSNLNPQIKVFLEFSNEVWNFAYSETNDVYNAGPKNITNPRRYALRCANMFSIWRNIWGNESNRIIRVLGTQAVNNFNAQEAMAELNGNFDVLSPALYFNYTKDGTCYQNLKNLGTSATSHDILTCAKNDFLTSWASVAQNNKDAWMYGKCVVQYEFGQGLTSDGRTEPFQDSTYAAQISAEMGTLYQQVLDSIKHWNTDQINAYALTGARKSTYGSWGHLEYIDQDTTTEPAPKYSVLLRNINPSVQGTCLYPGVPITASAGANGNISPAGTTLVNLNANQSYTITPNAGFCISNVVVDGNSVGPVSSFTFNNVVTTHIISASFSANVSAPSSISTTFKTDSSINLSWSAVSGANSYFIDVSSNASFTSLLNAYNNLSASSNTFSIIGLSASTKYFIRIRATNVAGCISPNSIVYVDSTNATIVSISLQAFIQGLYLGNAMMSAAPFNANSSAPTNIADTIHVMLRDSIAPHNIAYSVLCLLNTNGIVSCTFPAAAIGDAFYIAIAHRNSIETWSSSPVTILYTGTTYNFSNSISKAFGDNLVNDGNGVFMIYSGDINQDGSIDFNDYPSLDIRSSNGDLGYLPDDLNGDASVDFNDYPLLDINSSNGVIAITP